jgi:hypothetical protein
VHGLLEYGLGLLSIMAPFIFSFETDRATALSIALGTAVLVFGVVTVAPTGLVRSLPLDSHIVLDYLLALLLVASPFIFSFTDDGPAFAYFVVVGILHLLLTVLTRFRKLPKER